MNASTRGPVTLFLAGDVMTGRGIDQILPHPGKAELREPYVKSARTYVELAERLHGPVRAPVPLGYLWGDALAVLEQLRPRASIVNLETSITVSSHFWPGKDVHYRMRPDNVGCLQTAHLDVCGLANNHVLDFGASGLQETLEVLRAARIKTAGAGRDLDEARRPARLELGRGAELLVFAFGTLSSGIPLEWAAGPAQPGVHLLTELSPRVADEFCAHVRSLKRPGDLAMVSVHWGSNWGHEISPEQVAFAHRLIDGGVDLVHGHSSHHVRAVERYAGRLILYGCGDLITDYEGLRGHQQWKGHLGAMYFATLTRDGELAELRLVPTQMRRLRLSRVGRTDRDWLRETLNRVSQPFGASFEEGGDGTLALQQPHPQHAGAADATNRT